MTNSATAIRYLERGDHAILNGTEVVVTGWSTSANHTAARLGHNCGDEYCRRLDIEGVDVPATAWECKLAPVPAPLAEGQHVTRPVGDGRYVRVTCTRPGAAYHVDVVVPGPIAGVLETVDRAESTTSEAEARAYGNRLTEGLREQANETDMPAPEFIPVRYRSVPKGASRRMSDEQAETILAAGDGGTIHRGGHPGELNVSQLWALHDRRYVTAYAHRDRPHYILYAVVTTSGVERAAEILTSQTIAA